MQQYMMQWETAFPGGLPWRYTWSHTGDTMAIEYAKRHAMRLSHVADFGAMIVWRMNPAVEGDGQMIARLKVTETVSVENVLADAA